MRNYLIVFIALITVTALSAKEHFFSKPPIQKTLQVPAAMTDISWVDSPWEASDVPYIAIRKEVDEAIATGKSRQDIIRETGNAFIENKHDSKLAFRWAYAFRGESTFDAPHDRELAHQIIFGLNWAIKGKTVSYEYARIEFLVGTAWVTQRLFTPLGKRLLLHSPEDDVVKYALTSLYAYGDSDQKEKAKEHAQYFSTKHPNSYGAHATWAVIYLVDSKFGRGDQALAEKAIKESKIALAYIPNSSESKYENRRRNMSGVQRLIDNNRKRHKIVN